MNTPEQNDAIVDYSLYDSETNEYVSADDLGISNDEYDSAILESVKCPQAEGHIELSGRRLYAAE